MAPGPASYFRPIDETPGLVATLAHAVDELIGEGVDPDALRGAVPEGPLAGLAAVYAAVVSELAAHGWTYPAAAPRAAAGARAGSLPGLVLVDGFAFLRSLELELLGALAGGPTWSSRSTPTRALAAPTRSPSSPLGSPLRAASGHRHRRLPPS